MSGTVVSNVFRTSGVIAATAAGINFQSSVVTGTTLSVEAGNGYFINTTSNICTVTLPSSAAAGDQIVLVDFARTWGTNKIVIDSNGLNYQGQDDTYGVQYTTSGATVNIVYSGSSKGWTPISDDVVTDAPVAPTTQRAILGFGAISGGARSGLTNLVNSSGVVASDTAAVGTGKSELGAAGYGGDKGIFAFGGTGTVQGTSNLVNNSGVVGSDVSAVGTARRLVSAAGYGVGKAIFGFGRIANNDTVATTNLVTDQGVIGSDVSGVGSVRKYQGSATYGTDKAIFAYGQNSGGSVISLSNLVNNLGVVAADVTGVGTAREAPAATRFGSSGQALFTGGKNSSNSVVSTTNLVSNQGVVASNTSASGTSTVYMGAAPYGGDKAIVAYGDTTNVYRLITNTGSVGSNQTGVGTARYLLAASSYSYSA